jgi:hypothetical protein
LLHAQVVGYATNFAQAEDDLGPIELKKITAQMHVNDLVRTARPLRSPSKPAEPTVVKLPPATVVPAAAKATPLSTYILIGVGVLAVFGIGIAAARRLKG